MEFDEQTVLAPPPFVEIELVYTPPDTPAAATRSWCALRLYTKNHVYDLEWDMRCVKVHDVHNDVEIPNHRLLGAFLTGGQLRHGDSLELTYPLPKPGLTAVFETAGEKPEYVTTSEVTRVVLRMRVLSVSEGAAQPQWAELGSYRRVGPHGTRPGHGGDPTPR